MNSQYLSEIRCKFEEITVEGLQFPHFSLLCQQSLSSAIKRANAKLGLYSHKPVIFRHALPPCRRAGLYEGCSGGNGEVGDKAVLGLSGAVGDNMLVAVTGSSVNDVQRLGQRADLIGLYENGIRKPLVYSVREPVVVSNEEIVAHQHHPASEPSAKLAPALLVVLPNAVLNGDYGEFL